MNLREKKRITNENTMVEKERRKYEETEESSSKEKDRKGIIKKNRNYWPERKFYS